MLFGYKMLHCNSIKQKLNTKRKPGSKWLIWVITYHAIFFIFFTGSQGYDINEKLLFQDNQSAIKTNQNGKKLCTGNPRHIDTSYFFYKDRVESNKISIKYCSTEHMPAYCFMKYIQGALFTKFCDVIMGRKHVNNLQMGPPSTK